jgi:hypothetical protein
VDTWEHLEHLLLCLPSALFQRYLQRYLQRYPLQSMSQSAALVTFDFDDRGMWRVLNHVAQDALDNNEGPLDGGTILERIRNLHVSNRRLTGRGFGRGSPRKALTPFLRKDLFRAALSAEDQEYQLHLVLTRGIRHEQLLFRMQHTFDTTLYMPIAHIGESNRDICLPLEVAPVRRTAAVRRTLVVGVRRRQQTARARRDKIAELQVQFTNIQQALELLMGQ